MNNFIERKFIRLPKIKINNELELKKIKIALCKALQIPENYLFSKRRSK